MTAASPRCQRNVSHHCVIAPLAMVHFLHMEGRCLSINQSSPWFVVQRPQLMVFKPGVEIHRMSHDNSAAMRVTTGNNLSYWMSAVAINTAVLAKCKKHADK